MGEWVQWLVLLVTIAVVAFFLMREHKAQKKYLSGRKPAAAQHLGEDRDWSAIVAAAKKKAVAMARPAVALRLSDTPIGEDAHSSLGGCPSLSPEEPWPSDDDGNPMIFLAQINFTDMPPLDGYPTEGVLSFFVKNDDLNGCDFPSVDNTGFRVVYHENAHGLKRRELPVQNWDMTPFNDKLTHKGRRLTGETAIGPGSLNSVNLRPLTDDWYPDCPRELWEDFDETLTADKTSIIYYGGHPDFTQNDFRNVDDDPNYTEVLLQLGFLVDRERDAEICWGDAGEACFLITKDDLAAKRFDRVAYNWDCC